MRWSGLGARKSATVLGLASALAAGSAFSAPIALADVSVVIYRLPNGTRPEGITLGPDGNLWVAEASTNSIGVMDPSGNVLHEYSVVGAGKPYPNNDAYNEVDLHSIVTGPDGNLWITAGDGEPHGDCNNSNSGFSACGSIIKMTPAGDATKYDVPLASGTNCSSPCAEPEKVISGPGGDLWFTESEGPRIGRITTGGQFTMYTLPGLTGDVKGLTTGPDGNIWLTAPDQNKIGKLTPAGALTLYNTSNEPIFGIATGPDGALFFGEPGGIGRITTDGTARHYDLPSSLRGAGGKECEVHEIVPGPGGQLYFTLVDCDKVGRMTVDGIYTFYDLLTPPNRSSEPFGMTVGPAGNIWFTDTDNGYVGELQRGSSMVTVTSSQNPSHPGQAVTFTATVSGSGTDVPDGTVTFFDGGVTLGTSPVNAGAATLTTSSLTVGTHNITARYSGGTSFTGSVSAALAQVVVQNPGLPSAGGGPQLRSAWAPKLPFLAIGLGLLAVLSSPTWRRQARRRVGRR